MKYTAITKKPMKVDTKTVEPGTRLEVVGLHDHTVSCRPPGSSSGLFTVLRTEVDIEEQPEGKLYDVYFTVTGHMRVTVEIFEPEEGSDVMWTTDADAIASPSRWSWPSASGGSRRCRGART